jgi:DGQHR domain-containing protein
MIQKISVIVPENPFVPKKYEKLKPCLCVFDVEKLIKWWPGKPHNPEIYASKVKAIQRSLDWKRVAQMAAYLLQEEISDAQEKIKEYFSEIYEPKKYEPGREWPPKITKVIGYEESEYPVFSSILVHINGAELIEKKEVRDGREAEDGLAGELKFDDNDPDLDFSIIDGQHRINSAYFAIKLRQEKQPSVKCKLPAEVFLALDTPNRSAIQAQIFIDINYNQKKVDRSLVADLYPTARSGRAPLNDKERAQEIGRKLMLETGPLVGMIQIPGIKYGYKDVVTLATLNSAIENSLETLNSSGIEGIQNQTEFISLCLSAWLNASGRFEKEPNSKKKELSQPNVAYQGRVLISIMTLIPAIIRELKAKKIILISEKAIEVTTKFLKKMADNAGLLDDGIFIDRNKFKERKFLGSGGIALFRDLLWASIMGNKTRRKKPEQISKLAEVNRAKVRRYLTKK